MPARKPQPSLTEVLTETVGEDDGYRLYLQLSRQDQLVLAYRSQGLGWWEIGHKISRINARGRYAEAVRRLQRLAQEERSLERNAEREIDNWPRMLYRLQNYARR